MSSSKGASVFVVEVGSSKATAEPVVLSNSRDSGESDSAFIASEKKIRRTKTLASYLSISTVCIVCLFLLTLPGSPLSLTYHKFKIRADEVSTMGSNYFSMASDYQEATQSISTQEYSSWMSEVPDSTPMTLINLPGTHDSTARFGSGSYVCQTLSLKDQLRLGVRFFDIRLMLSNNRLSCQHGRVSQQLDFDQVLSEMNEFLATNPTEAVFLKIQQEHTRYSAVDFGGSVADAVASNMAIYSAPNTINATNIPTLQDIRGKMVLIPRFFNFTNINTIQYEAMTAQDDFKADLQTKTAAIVAFYDSTQQVSTIDDAKSVGSEKRHWHSDPEERQRIADAKALGITWHINYFSLHNNVVLPRDAAFDLNPLIASIINPISALASSNMTTATTNEIEAIRRKPFGVVMMDFIGVDSVRLIVDSNF